VSRPTVTTPQERRAHGHYDAPCARCRAVRYIKGRNLCAPCWGECDRDGTLTDWPPRKARLPLPELLAEYELLASAGNTHDTIAERLGFKSPWWLAKRITLARAAS
jgi:hypothetical protein